MPSLTTTMLLAGPLGQDPMTGTPPMSGDGMGTPLTADPADVPAGAAPSSGVFGNQFFLIILLAMGAMIVFSMLGQRREKKKKQSMLDAIGKHDMVQTIGGVIGSVVEIKSDRVIVKVDESSNTRITFSRSAIQQVMSGDGEPSG